ncbi:hypothetical protein [Actinophytocola sp.]|uniref:hypothetical protein n=1 Tax=Actinophytocola sp. TaxID=1872138 RepID=UPI003899DCC0
MRLFLALPAAVPIIWGSGPRRLDLVLAALRYPATHLDVTVGFHRYFTHRTSLARAEAAHGTPAP